MHVVFHSPLEISGHGDLPVDQGLHDSADHLVQRAGHVLAQLALETLLNLVPTGADKRQAHRHVVGQ